MPRRREPRRVFGIRIFSTLVAISALLASGCGESLDCSAIGAPLAPMFQVIVLDSITGNPFWWQSTVTIEDGSFSEVLQAQSNDPADSTVVLAFFSRASRVGTYTVQVERAGFQNWVSRDHEIVKSGCFLTSVTLEARLQR